MISYQANYDQIARDHIAHWKATGENPFIPADDANAFDEATAQLVMRYSRSNDAILDAGCGMGNVLSRVTDRQRFGCDISEDYLAIARERGIEAVHAVLEALPYADASFDLVLATDVMEHVLDLNAVLRELVRVLKPGGVLITRTPDSEDLWPYLDCPYYFVHVRRFDEPSLRLLFGRVFGFPVLECPRVRTEIHAVVAKPLERVSILLATKDRPEWVPTAIASVLAQDDPAWELVVLDNGESIRHLVPDDPRIIYQHADTTGPADAFGKALALASGDVVMPLSDDDTLAPETVRIVRSALTGREWGYARTAYFRGGALAFHLGEPWDLGRLRGGYYLGGAVFWRKRLSDRLGGFDPTFDHAADWDLYLRFGEDSEPVFLSDVLYNYTDWPGADTNVHHDLQVASGSRIVAR